MSPQQKVATNEFEQANWKFNFSKSCICSSQEMDYLQNLINLQQLPDVIFGKNFCNIIYQPNNFSMNFNAVDALRYCNYEFLNSNYFEYKEKEEITEKIMHINHIPGQIQLAAAEQWKKKDLSEIDVKVLEKISDSFYSTPYKGTLGPCKLQQTDLDINVGNLTEQNSIIFTDMCDLWEDELGDNGLTFQEFRFRCMKDCFFGLLRHYIRVDGVIVRIFDTRIYHEFKDDFILREFSVRESTYEELQAKGFTFSNEILNDGHAQSFKVYNILDIKKVVKDKIFFK